MSYFLCFYSFLLLNAARASFGKDREIAPEWSPVYSVDGEMIIPKAKVQQPFKAWYDAISGISRIDFYKGIDRTYCFSEMGNYGMYFKVVPVNTKNGTNTIKCFAINGTEKLHIVAQSVLPDLKNYILFSKHFENGTKVEKWVSTVTNEKTVSIFEFVLYRKDNVIYPLTFNVKGLNPLFIKHFDNYHVEYKNFSAAKPDPSIFNIEGLKCEPFPKPREDHVYNFNPKIKYNLNNYENPLDFAYLEQFKHRHEKTSVLLNTSNKKITAIKT